MLEVSRPLEINKIVDYPEDERIIKLPIQNYISLLPNDESPGTPIVLNRPQNAIVNAVNDPRYRFITACVSRRVGKTYISNIIGQLVSLMPNTTMLIIAPDYSLATISWDLQRRLLDLFDVERVKDNAKERVIELINGSIIRIASVSRVDSAVGRSYDLIIFDEAALNDDGGTAFNIALRPTLDKIRSKCIFISTPRGHNWFHEFYMRGFSDDTPEWISIHADYRENPRATDRDIVEARKTMSKAEFEQEYLANFVVFEGQIWGIRDTQILDLTPFRNWVYENRVRIDCIGGLDVGFKDATAFCVVVPPSEGSITLGDKVIDLNKWRIIDEYYTTAKSTEAHALNLAKKIEYWDVDYTFIDSAAAQTRFDLAATYEIPTVNAKKSVVDGIGFVAALVENDLFEVHEECHQVVNSMLNYKWNPNPNLIQEKPIHDESSHMADAIRYAIYTYGSGMGGVY